MKRTNRYEKTLSRLPDTLEWSNRQDIGKAKEFLLTDNSVTNIFLGSGGSLSAAHLAAQLSLEKGIVAVAMTPYSYIFSAWSKIPAKVILLSAGGHNVDIINAFKTVASRENQKAGAILMSTPSLLENMMSESGCNDIFTFDLYNSDGFLATNSLAAFYSLFFRIYRDEKITADILEYAESTEKELKRFIADSYTLPTAEWNEHDAALYGARETDRFYVLYSPDTAPVAIDLESRFSEGSIGCLQISDYRNFAHGRFNWFHQRKGQTAIIALVTPESECVAETILTELPADIPVMRLSTSKRGSAGIMELLFKGMYMSKYLAQRWGLDIGAPEVAEFGKIIHKKNFMDVEESAKTATNNVVCRDKMITDDILRLPIMNLSRVCQNIVRGETLWASRNRKYIDAVIAAGTEVIIDLRTADFTDRFAEICKSKGVEYIHFPVDKANVSDLELLKTLDVLFDALDNRNCYISCQQGLHRTDLALAIYYMFHCQDFVPELSGHIKNGEFRCDDIMRRLNSLFRTMESGQTDNLTVTPINEAEFRHRRKKLLEFNRRARQNQND